MEESFFIILSALRIVLAWSRLLEDRRLNKLFADFASWSAWATGHALAFVLATTACIIWAVTGPFFDYSDTWQLVINTGTTVLTFLMVFVLQHSQNRDAIAIQAKLDEIIKTHEGRSKRSHRV